MIYCMSDIHGCADALEKALNRIVLADQDEWIFLGDYIDIGPDSLPVVKRLIDLKKTLGPHRVTFLRGNHEELFSMWLSDPSFDWAERHPETLKSFLPGEVLSLPAREQVRFLMKNHLEEVRFLISLPLCEERDQAVFVHASVNETHGSDWRSHTNLNDFLWKQAETGPFIKTVVAGHTSTAVLAGSPGYHLAYFDGESHWFLDGDTASSGCLPVLAFDPVTGVGKQI